MKNENGKKESVISHVKNQDTVLDETKKTGSILIFLIVGICIASYLGRFTYIPSVGWVPNLEAFIFATFGFFYLGGRLSRTGVLSAGLLMIIAAVAGLLSRSFPDHLRNLVLSACMLGYGLFIGLVLYNLTIRVENNRLYRMTIVALIVLCVIAVLEVFTPFGIVVADIREAIFRDARISHSLARDMRLHGGLLRPTAFASEPSYLAVVFSGLSIILLILSRGRRVYIPLVIWAIGTLLIRSPIMLAFPMSAVAIYFSVDLRKNDSERVLGKNAASIVAYLILIGIVAAGGTMISRIDRIAEGTDNSTQQRLIEPASIAEKVISRNPIVGAGIGGDEAVRQTIISVYEKESYFSRIKDKIGGRIGGAAIAIWTYFGVGAGGLFVLVLVYMSGRLSGGNGLLVWSAFSPLAFVLPMAPRVWFMLFLVTASVLISRQGVVRDVH